MILLSVCLKAHLCKKNQLWKLQKSKHFFEKKLKARFFSSLSHLSRNFRGVDRLVFRGPFSNHILLFRFLLSCFFVFLVPCFYSFHLCFLTLLYSSCSFSLCWFCFFFFERKKKKGKDVVWRFTGEVVVVARLLASGRSCGNDRSRCSGTFEGRFVGNGRRVSRRMVRRRSEHDALFSLIRFPEQVRG